MFYHMHIWIISLYMNECKETLWYTSRSFALHLLAYQCLLKYFTCMYCITPFSHVECIVCVVSVLFTVHLTNNIHISNVELFSRGWKRELQMRMWKVLKRMWSPVSRYVTFSLCGRIRITQKSWCLKFWVPAMAPAGWGFSWNPSKQTCD